MVYLLLMNILYHNHCFCSLIKVFSGVSFFENVLVFFPRFNLKTYAMHYFEC